LKGAWLRRLGRRALASEYLVLALSVAYFLVLLPWLPELAHPRNLANLFSRMLPLLLVAMGQTFVLIAGGIDLSVTAVIGLTSVLGASLMTADGGWMAGHAAAVPAGIALMLLTGALLGAANGAAVTGLRMPPFMVTLTSMMFLGGLAVWLTQSQRITGLPPAFLALGGKPACAFGLTLGAALFAHLLLSRSLFGRWLYAIGHNPRVAAISGVPVPTVTLAAYVLSGISGACAAILFTGRLETGSPVHGREILLDVIGATVIGGTSLFGGKGKILWTLYGVLFLTLVDASLNLMFLSDFAIRMVKGALILLAALIDALRHRYETA